MKASLSATCNCLVRFLGRRDLWALFFFKWSWNGLRYRTMINIFLWPELEDMDVGDIYFQQNGATCHTSGETIGLLRENFPGWVISWSGDYNWPLRPCDLTPSDFFFGVTWKITFMLMLLSQFKNSKRRFVPLSTK